MKLMDRSAICDALYDRPAPFFSIKVASLRRSLSKILALPGVRIIIGNGKPRGVGRLPEPGLRRVILLLFPALAGAGMFGDVKR
jgi:hypothetical protein